MLSPSLRLAMTKIKICGIRRPCDINYINELLPEYVGFVFAKSKRQVNMRYAYNLIENLRKGIQKVGVFVNENPSVVIEIAENLQLEVLQFHGHETQEYIDQFKGYKIWKALKINDIESISQIRHYKCTKFLLDNKIGRAHV